MRTGESVIRQKTFQAEEKRRALMRMEGLIAEFNQIASDLEREIHAEEKRTGVHERASFAYPTWAKAAIQRCENVKRSAEDLKPQLDAAKAAFEEALGELKKAEELNQRTSQQASVQMPEVDLAGSA